tara:strand:- start:578 stop:829 length:252 start_codon:yes stop_codon:yes gene_type:complete
MSTPFKMKYKNSSFPFRTDLTKKTGLGPRAHQLDPNNDDNDNQTRSEFDKDQEDYDKKDAIYTRISEGSIESQDLRRKQNKNR